jgi:membrane protein YdbS with pleckstrin-like domain
MSAEPGVHWRRLHPVTIIREFLGVAWNIVIAVIVFGALRDGGLFGGIEILIPLAFLGLAVGRYVSTRYAITPDTVLWRRGILFRQRVEVPRARIQNVSSGADVLGRVFGLRTVTISTAGSEGELQLALVATDESSFLLGELLGRRPPVEGTGPVPPEAGEGPIGPTPAPPGPPEGAPAAPAPWGPPPPVGPPRRDLPPPPAGRSTAPPAMGGGVPPGPLWPSPPPSSRALVSLTPAHLLRFAVTGIGAGTVLVAIGAGVLVATTGSVQPVFLLVFVLGGRLLSVVELNDFQLTAEADRIRVRHG